MSWGTRPIVGYAVVELPKDADGPHREGGVGDDARPDTGIERQGREEDAQQEDCELRCNNVEPPDEPEIPIEATCADCRLFDPCPCGCGHGKCDSWGQWTESTCSGRYCEMWEVL